MSDTVIIEFTIIGRYTVSREQVSPEDGPEMSDDEVLDGERYNVDTLYEPQEIIGFADGDLEITLELV